MRRSEISQSTDSTSSDGTFCAILYSTSEESIPNISDEFSLTTIMAERSTLDERLEQESVLVSAIQAAVGVNTDCLQSERQPEPMDVNDSTEKRKSRSATKSEAAVPTKRRTHKHRGTGPTSTAKREERKRDSFDTACCYLP